MDKVTSFLHFVASNVIRADFAEDAEDFSQSALRKLTDLGIVEYTPGENDEPGEYTYTEPDDLEDEG